MAGGETKQPTKNMKPNPLLFATLAGIQFVLPAFAVDSTATSSTEVAEIEALKQSLAELKQLVQTLAEKK